jgi:predicted dehydrogenase
LINRILIIGIGSIGKRHLHLARELVPNADIRVFRHKATNEVPEYSNGCFSSIEESVAFEPRIAVIASPAPFHISTAQALERWESIFLLRSPYQYR